jgi:hypothetical protein
MPDENEQNTDDASGQVFLARGPSRSRAMRAVLAGGALLIVIWLVALGLGIGGGFDALPSFGLGSDNAKKAAPEAEATPAATEVAPSANAGTSAGSKAPSGSAGQKPSTPASTPSSSTHGQSGATHGKSGATHGKPAGSGSGSGSGKPTGTPGNGTTKTKALPLGQLK